MKGLSSDQVVIHDSYWSPRLEVNARSAIFHQWEKLEASGCIDNFRIATAEKQGFRRGWFFADSDAYKWLEAAAKIQGFTRDPQLELLVSDFVALLGRCQTPDGYLFTYNQIHYPGLRWINLQIEHELYCHGHLIEAGVSHYLATRQNDLLEISIRAANLLVKEFLGAPPRQTPGHEEVEIALLRLYELTENSAYLDLAQHFLEQRGRTPLFGLSLVRQNGSANARTKDIQKRLQGYQQSHPEFASLASPEHNQARRPPLITLRWYTNAITGKYFQQHTPIRKQTIPVGHSVRYAYLQTATTMLSRALPDPSLLPVLQQSWEHMVLKRMYVTGGIGSLPVLEGFGRDFELDPEYAYAETCAALGSLFWNWEMTLATKQARYSDLFEWQLYNAAGVGMGLGGKEYLYNNPLSSRSGIVRKEWYEVPCCPSNLSRTWGELSKYLYSTEDSAIWVHQYLSSTVNLFLEQPVRIEMESEFPWNGQVRMKLRFDSHLEFSFFFRLPSWSISPKIDIRSEGASEWTSLNVPVSEGEISGRPGPHISRQEVPAQGYDPRRARFFHLKRLWQPGDEILLTFDMPIEIRRAHPKVRSCTGKVAVTRGPLVYCLESLDNPDLDIFSVELQSDSLQPELAKDLFNGIIVLRGKTSQEARLTFIPYQLWANRAESSMTVWVKCEDRALK